LIELAILGLLHDQDLHGYELRKRISDLAGLRPAVSFGSLYPALARLEAAGALKAVDGSPAAMREAALPILPLTGSLAGEAAAFLARKRAGLAERTGRAERVAAGARPPPPRGRRSRKAYGITDQGRQQLLDLMVAPSTDDRAFALKVAFCRYLPPVQRLELFERRRATLAGRLAGERADRRTVTDRLDGYLRSLREHDHKTIQHDIAWLDELITTERAALAGTLASREEDTEP
jgi:DNA-binding PadR family transcriptional regulator